jgi:hypothetical protein
MTLLIIQWFEHGGEQEKTRDASFTMATSESKRKGI